MTETSTVGGAHVSRETIAKLEVFSDLVRKWTPRINLIARASTEDMWDRHIVDSAQLYRFAPPVFEKWVDLGSGGGFPGIIMATIAAEKQPNARFVLIESDQRKATFLRTASRELDLKVTVLAERIEIAPPQEADVVSARALTALSGLLLLAQRHIGPEGLCILHKGRQAAREIADAQVNWQFHLEDHQSITDPEARLLVIQRIVNRAHGL